MNEPMKLEKNRILRNARDVYKYKKAEYYPETIRKSADELESALLELSAIKQRGEEWQERFTKFNEGLSKQRQTKLITRTQYENRIVIKTIDYILKGETK